MLGTDGVKLRVVKALTVTELGVDFPGVVQAARIMRFRTNAKTGKLTRKTIYAITDLTCPEASPERISWLARSQWGIENRLHSVRDVAFAEDASRVHTEHGPENMATLRNRAIGTLRRAGHHNTAAALRHLSYRPHTRAPRPHRPVPTSKVTRSLDFTTALTPRQRGSL
ncbi:hypothetical protein QCN29_35760 [Streptomyces sp. HNM0663]|uniref:Transposase n=1 Tax=Streptomyces chengmaiensis TaxID=3040919 RepID=A0ABT6HZ76_9ACTN|nr:hypothetical protein [Streptomyces chengmaiensis]MDH2394011.1 hypothetical protein [Streptomyces chengmaiensis]